LRSAPATVSGATIRPPQAGFTPSAALGPYEFRPELIPDEGALTVPAGGVVATPPATPPFEMGALSAAAPAAPPRSAVAPPTEAELRALPASLAEASAQAPQPESSPSALASPGSSYYFLEAAPAPSLPVASAFPHGDYGFDPAMLPELGLLAGPYDPRTEQRNFPV